jgi:hypothetical protein
MVRNEAVRRVLNIVVLSLTFWWGVREGRRAGIARKDGKDG